MVTVSLTNVSFEAENSPKVSKKSFVGSAQTRWRAYSAPPARLRGIGGTEGGNEEVSVVTLF